ncbi:MAG: phosphodiester glycosidase family protein, partial [Defluviitaleaceae bacterium]|nr:phosphodiester glycosidase family protein [Defluviitaleaceae bacterium]
MHLDGGGSSTMAVAESLRPMTVRNTLSDGSQRRIINGLGVFNNSTPSAPVSLAIELDDYLFAGVPSRLSVFASDRYLNKTALHSGDFTVDAGDGGYYSDGYFFPTRTGHITLVITAGSMTAAKTLTSGRLAQINAPDTVRIAHGGEHRIRLTGICADGFTGAISGRGVNIEVFPPGLVSRPEPETLIGASTGAGYIKYTAGGVERYSLLIVGTRDVTLENFAPGGREIRYIAVPAENAGHVRYISTPGGPRLELAYQMAAAATTQAAYASFPQPIEIAGQPLSLRLRVYGDNSNNWLRGRIADADGEFHIIDFARHIDWEGARTVEARLPANIATPVTLDRIYVAALENTETETRQLWFDSLTAVYSIDAGHVAVPDSMVFADRKMTELGAEQRAFTDIMLIGDLVPADAPPNYGSIQDNSKAEFNTIHGETFGIFFGETDNIGARMPVFRKASGTYSAYRLGGADVISLTAANGSMFSSNAEQWQNIRRHLASAGRNVLVLFDKNPLTSMPAKELELLQRQFVNSGRNIIVVSSEGTRTTTTVTDGVRYVNLGSLFLEDGSVNGEFKTLRVRFFEDDLRYSLK